MSACCRCPGSKAKGTAQQLRTSHATMGSFSKKEKKKERPTPVARRTLRGPLQARATEGFFLTREVRWVTVCRGPVAGDEHALADKAVAEAPTLVVAVPQPGFVALQGGSFMDVLS
jgi:hypothetical protein